MATAEKSAGAFKTIGELSQELGVAQHVLRYWETRFPQLKPMQRAGNRRYYRPADVELAGRINRLLNEEGYTVRGVQKLLRDKGGELAPAQDSIPQAAMPVDSYPGAPSDSVNLDVFRLIELRNRLADALDD
jgi:DNA-binding transcriptional MerR regulator